MKSSDFIGRSLMSALSFLKDSVFAEEYSLRKGFLQGIDPRLKISSFALLFIAAILLKKIELLILLYCLCLLLVVLSKISLGYFIKRTWIFIPLFSLFIAVPAIFSIFSPGEAIVTLKLIFFQLIITREGVRVALLFVLRVLVSVSYAVVLSLTTRHTALLRVLRIFGIPQVFIMTLGMCYRYIYLFVQIIENTYLSIKSRVGRVPCHKKGQIIVTWNMAYLWQKSYGLSQQVYGAMLSRGYRGEPAISDDFKAKLKDWAWLSFAVVFFVAILYLNAKLI
jgi:cobalt/nickel transport system permease protein